MDRKNDEVLKIRSVRGTVAAGFRLYIGYFRRILKLTWLPAVVCAIVSALYNQVTFSMLPQLMAVRGKGQSLGDMMVPMLQIQGMSLLDALVSLVFIAYGFSLLSRHREQGSIPVPTGWLTRPDWPMLLRTLLSAVVWLVVMTICGGVSIGITVFGAMSQSLTTMVLGVLIGVVLLAFILPLVYPNLRYVTSRDTRLFMILGSGYRQGLRHWGYMFGVLLVTLIVTLVALIITTLPSIVLSIANMKAQAGTLMGDPLGMPDYMTWMSFLVFLLAGFVQCYVVLLLHFPAYYMTGSIEKQEQERQENNTRPNT